MDRRDFLRVLGSLAVLPGAAVAAGKGSTHSLSMIKGSPLDKKVRLFQDIYEQVAFHPSGIMYSMLHLEGDRIRPFKPSDVVGAVGIDATVGKFQLDSYADYLHGENSITASGLYLAAQSLRYRATKDDRAMEQAARAFNSLDLIYKMGEKAGKPGWMGKPYGFKPSNQTAADQYLDACFGLWNYHEIAPAGHKQRIEEMFFGFADYWRGADYVISYFGSHWDLKGETDSYNSIFMMINSLAFYFSKANVYMREIEKLMQRQTWTHTTRIESLRATAVQKFRETGKPEMITYSAAFSLAKDVLKPSEILCWETTIHSKFVAVAADIIAQTCPQVLNAELADVLPMWWSEWKYGMGADCMPYYWFAVDLINDTWRPLPRTDFPSDRSKWLFGDPFTSYLSQVRWMDPMARFMVTSLVTARHAPKSAVRAKALAQRMMASLDTDRLHWMLDTDGKQLVPEISYYGKCLSSELPGSFLASYWAGKCEGYW